MAPPATLADDLALALDPAQFMHACGLAPDPWQADLLRSIWGYRRYQRKIFGKGDSDELSVGHQARLHLKKQHVVLYVTSRAERDITVLDSKTGSVSRVVGHRNRLINSQL